VTDNQQEQQLQKNLDSLEQALQVAEDHSTLFYFSPALRGAAARVQEKIQETAGVANMWRDLDAGQRAQFAEELEVDLELLQQCLTRDADQEPWRPVAPERIAQLWKPGSTAALLRRGESPVQIAKYKKLLAAADVHIEE
jgi:hypothetical protein